MPAILRIAQGFFSRVRYQPPKQKVRDRLSNVYLGCFGHFRRRETLLFVFIEEKDAMKFRVRSGGKGIERGAWH